MRKAAPILLAAITACVATQAGRHDVSGLGRGGSTGGPPTDAIRQETSARAPAPWTETLDESDIPRCTDRVVREAVLPAHPNEVICDRDSDCIIANKNLNNPCDYCWVDPYAISKAAPSREVGEYRTCTAIGYLCDWPTCPNKFVAICVQHTCERRLKK